MMAVLTPHKTWSLSAFLKRPIRRLEKVTSKELFSSIFFISILCLCFIVILMFAIIEAYLDNECPIHGFDFSFIKSK